MMEAASAAFSLQSSSWIGGERLGKRSSGLRVSRGFDEERRFRVVDLRGSRLRSCTVQTKGFELKISCNYKKSGAEESSNFCSSVDEDLTLKRRSDDVLPYLDGQCIYLVGMMGSGKTTVGEIISKRLDYSFCDSDKLVEQNVGMSSVAQIFEERGEAFFRDIESKVLRDLSTKRRLVVATGGGAVIRPINWRYMKQGVTIWLDVPLEALARRIAAVGTSSRPLLNGEHDDPYTKAFLRLSMLSKERGEAYANADARVCLQSIADNLGHGDVSSLTPETIANEALVRIKNFLTIDMPARK